MGIELQAFQDTFSELSDEEKHTLYGFALINQCYTSEQAQAYVAALIKFQKLFAAKWKVLQFENSFRVVLVTDAVLNSVVFSLLKRY